MSWTIKKWALPVLAAALMAGAPFTRKTFHVERVIAATPNEIWAVLMDTAAYPEWNPVFVEVEGEYSGNARILSHVRDPKGKILKINAKVRSFLPARELRQYGGIPGVITFDHQWLLEEVPGGTRVVQHEIDRGLYLWVWDSSWIEPAYAGVLEALKDEVLRR